MGNTIKTTVLLAAMTALLVLAGRAVGGQGGMVFAFFMALVMNMGAYWFSGDIALRMAGAREIGPEEAPWLHQMVERLARQAGLPKPKVGIIETDAANAFATGRDPQHAVVAVTTGIVNILDRDELEGVLAHELGKAHSSHVLGHQFRVPAPLTHRGLLRKHGSRGQTEVDTDVDRHGRQQLKLFAVDAVLVLEIGRAHV